MSIKVCVVNIGNELLLGRTINTNLSWLGTQLTELGLPVTRSVTIQDIPQEIKETLIQEWQQNDVLILTGGLGPTDDDLTKMVIADFFGKNLEFREDVWKDVQEIFTRRNIVIPEINRSQAMIPTDFIALKNTKGTAPGLYFSENGKHFFALPGVPLEMKSLFTDFIRDILSTNFACEPIHIRQLHTWNVSESVLAEKLTGLDIPEDVKLAWLPQIGRVDLRLYGKNLVPINKLYDEIYEIAKDWIWGKDDETPQSVVYNLMTTQKLTLSVAESCTGGLVQELMTSISGASNYFSGGIISYNNDVKINQLNVKQETLESYGSVSIETASEMALGVRQVLNSDVGISITGIAGPKGGSREKPVGTVCFGISDKSQLITKRIVFNGNRETIRIKAAEYVILLLINHIRSRA